MTYVLITPVKNEEKYLPYHIDSVLHQTILPKIWVIIDGNSQDNSISVIHSLCKDHDWIVIIKQQQFSNLGGHHNFSLAVREAYNFIVQIARERDIDFKFVAKLDADAVISPNYFQRLIEEFEKNSSLAVASGKPFSIRPNVKPKNFSSFSSKDIVPDRYPSNSLPDKRLYRKDLLLKTGGFPSSKYSPDTVILARFRMQKYSICMCNDCTVINLRADTGIEKNIWKSSIQMGRARYYLAYHPILIATGGLYLLIHKGFISASGMLIGYLLAWVKNQDQIDDDLVKNYFHKYRIKEI